MAKRIEDDAPTFEGNSETLLRSRRVLNLYDSAKPCGAPAEQWDEPNGRERGKGHDSRRKDHRRNNKSQDC